MLSVSSLDVLKRRGKGGGPWPWLLNTGDRLSQPPPLPRHKSPSPDLLFLTLEHRPYVREGKAEAGRGNRMPPRDHTVNTADDSSSFSLHSPLPFCSSPLHLSPKRHMDTNLESSGDQFWMEPNVEWDSVGQIYEQGQCIQTDLTNTRHFFLLYSEADCKTGTCQKSPLLKDSFFPT